MVRVDNPFAWRKSYLGVCTSQGAFLLRADDRSSVVIASGSGFEVRHVMIGRYMETVLPAVSRFFLFRFYREILQPASQTYDEPAAGQRVLRAGVRADGVKETLSLDPLGGCEPPGFDLGPDPLQTVVRGSPRSLAIPPGIYREGVVWLEHPWICRSDFDAESRQMERRQTELASVWVN